ncbi:MAG: type II toxin-antitoxin system RelE/ParE family toxin [Oscillospiraceae bacterium]|nr:type II toxin-antitoxin system RelE/ParE family toxin [Oscillospiraceae bacterium]
MYKLRYLPSANLDMIEAESYLFEYSPPAADKLSLAFEENTDALIGHPFMYPVYRGNPYFRFITLPYEYLCFYHVDEEAKIINVHRVLHGMRDIQSILSE